MKELRIIKRSRGIDDLKKIISKVLSFLIVIMMMLCTAFSVNAVESTDIFNKLNSTIKYLTTLGTPSVGSIGGEWMVIDFARSGNITEEFAEGYYQNAFSYVEAKGSSKLSNSKSTDNSRMIIALTSIGKDVTNVSGYNLLEPLADFEYVVNQGINGAIWALIALDTKRYEIPCCVNITETTTREKLINYILSMQLSDGGWDLMDRSADPDMTAMALQSLAPYYNTDEEVHNAVDNALSCISAIQNDNGGFSSWGAANSESCAQVIVALTSLGINPENDERFIKNDNTIMDAVMSFSVDNGFSHIHNSKYDQMATEQSVYALAAYQRLIENNTSLYDMRDVDYLNMDVNLDGIVSIDDVTEIQKYLAHFVKLNSTQITIADADGDSIVCIDDATYIQKFLANIEISN